MKIPQIDDPINTVYDLVERKITIFEGAKYIDNRRDIFFSVNTTEWDYVAKTMVPADFNCYYSTCSDSVDISKTYHYFVKHHLHGNKTHAFIRGYLLHLDSELIPDKNNWWRSEKLDFGFYPYGALLTSRNWIFNEVNPYYPLQFLIMKVIHRNLEFFF